jgi:UDPglucose 6-dehydrogenase
MKKYKKITVVGTGYVGLVTGACLSDLGIEVTCVDIDQKKIDGLKNGILPIYEPGLKEIVERNYAKGRLNFSTQLSESIQDSAAAFISVGTPPGEDGSADLKYVLAVADEIGKTMTDYLVVITKSTVPVGTAEKVRGAVASALDLRAVDFGFDVASNPEFLKEGAAIDDFMKPDRIVIGVDSKRAQETLDTLYRPFTLNGHPVIFMDIPSAEMTKYAANAMLATKISFMNDIANLCEKMGADVNWVRRGIGSDPRIGNKFIYPGIGYGGSCFPKDVKALARTGRENGHTMRILEAVEAVNDDQKSVLFNKINAYFGGNLKGKTVAFWGLSFKPNTDDMREAPSIVLANLLTQAGAYVRAYDPVAMEEAKHDLGDTIAYCESDMDAVQGADALALITEWTEFRVPNWEKVGVAMNTKVVFDGRNLYRRVKVEEAGFDYYGLGMGENVAEKGK